MPIGFVSFPQIFTTSQSQDPYEYILEVKSDRRGFANKMPMLSIHIEVRPRSKAACGFYFYIVIHPIKTDDAPFNALSKR